MHSSGDVLCIIYILQNAIGALGNGLLLHHYGPNLIGNQTTRPIDLIFLNLAFSHIFLFLFRGVPFTIQACIQEVFLFDIGCKIIVYLQRVCRGLSLCTTCLMSFFQAITITSCSSKWAELKARASQYIGLSFVFIWVLNLLVDVIVPLYVTGHRNNTDTTLNLYFADCSINIYAMTVLKLVIWKSVYDAVYVGLMAATSGYMVFVLFRHHQQVQHLHDSSFRPSTSREIRATKVILFLVSIFVFFYSISSILVIIMHHSKERNQWMIYISVFFTLCYPTLSPFVLISGDSKILSCNVLKRMRAFAPPFLARFQSKYEKPECSLISKNKIIIKQTAS